MSDPDAGSHFSEHPHEPYTQNLHHIVSIYNHPWIRRRQFLDRVLNHPNLFMPQGLCHKLHEARSFYRPRFHVQETPHYN